MAPSGSGWESNFFCISKVVSYLFLLYRTALLVYPLLCLEFFLPIATWILPLGTYSGTVNAGIHRMELVLLHVSNPIVYGSSFSI